MARCGAAEVSALARGSPARGVQETLEGSASMPHQPGEDRIAVRRRGAARRARRQSPRGRGRAAHEFARCGEAYQLADDLADCVLRPSWRATSPRSVDRETMAPFPDNESTRCSPGRPEVRAPRADDGRPYAVR
jgi:hypothetical protein